MFSLNTICKKTIIVKAGGNGKGTTSKKKAPIKTKKYFQSIFAYSKLSFKDNPNSILTYHLQNDLSGLDLNLNQILFYTYFYNLTLPSNY
jgi:hypothetical protein